MPWTELALTELEVLTVTFDVADWPARSSEGTDEHAERVLGEMGYEVDVLLTVTSSPEAQSLGAGEPIPVHRGPFTVTVEFRGRRP